MVRHRGAELFKGINGLIGDRGDHPGHFFLRLVLMLNREVVHVTQPFLTKSPFGVSPWRVDPIYYIAKVLGSVMGSEGQTPRQKLPTSG